MTNEVNKLIWPSTNGIGIIDEAAWDQTVEIALNTKNETGATIITEPPPESAYTNEYVEQALDELRGGGRRRRRRRLRPDRGHPQGGRQVTDHWTDRGEPADGCSGNPSAGQAGGPP